MRTEAEKKPFRFAVIGGTAPMNLGLKETDRFSLSSTPYGKPSEPAVCYRMNKDVELVWLNRHGKFHKLSPSRIPYAANIRMLMEMNVHCILSLSACGNLRESVEPGKDLVIPDQTFDLTAKGLRPQTLFPDFAVHISHADPFCPEMRKRVFSAASALCKGKVHYGGTHVVIEGPGFSTRAESKTFRQIHNAIVIGETTQPEAKLAQEAMIHYCVLAFPSDDDSWKEDGEPATAEMIFKNLKKYGALSLEIIHALAEDFACDSTPFDCGCENVMGPNLEAVHTDIAGYLKTCSPEEEGRLREKYEIFGIMPK
ncbi:MTAP family purine nucleoside phosphorylase [Patescibacteria group bacterium]|nr:MTAP family purine nucleoside phosphorylase [Patescibacteria group bacterium]